MRILLIFLALAIIVLVVKRLWSQSRSEDKPRRQLTGRMVQCSHCGVYLPEQEALRDRDLWYCSKEHRDAGRQAE